MQQIGSAPEKSSSDSGCLGAVEGNGRDLERIDSPGEPISIYRSGEAGRIFSEKTARLAEEVMFYLEGAIDAAAQAVRAEELPDEFLRELRETHTQIRQQALSSSPQGRLV